MVSEAPPLIVGMVCKESTTLSPELLGPMPLYCQAELLFLFLTFSMVSFWDWSLEPWLPHIPKEWILLHLFPTSGLHHLQPGWIFMKPHLVTCRSDIKNKVCPKVSSWLSSHPMSPPMNHHQARQDLNSLCPHRWSGLECYQHDVHRDNCWGPFVSLIL